MGAFRTILTHFSSRLHETGLSNVPEGCKDVIVSFDFMRVPLRALPSLPGLTPRLKEVLRPAPES